MLGTQNGKDRLFLALERSCGNICVAMEIAPSLPRNAKPRASAGQAVQCLGLLLYKALTYMKVRVLTSPE